MNLRKRPAGRTRHHSYLGLLLFAGAWALAATTSGQTGVPPQWSPALADAWERYELSDYAETQRLCRAARGDQKLRDDADALAALASMRSGGRAERLFGRSSLRDISQRRPGMEQRPECLLALGIAARELNESANALLALTGALERFAQRSDQLHEAQAAVELAETWRRHNEWERMDPALQVVIPKAGESKGEARLAQITKLAERAASWPVSLADERLAIEVTRARAELDLPSTRAAGRQRLERCAASLPLTAAVANACLLLADDLEANGETEAAIPLLERARGGPSPQFAEAAAKKLASITRSQIEIEAPEMVAPDAVAAVHIRIRNVRGLRVELRRVDLPAWLESRRGVVVDAQLPITGALLSAGEPTLPAAGSHDWIDVNAETPGMPSMALPDGAYVLLVSGLDADAGPVATRRLLLASRLEAGAIIGSDAGIIWAPGAAADTRALFWVAGGFVPQKLTLADGVVQFNMPSETRILRDRRWACLVQSGDEFALVRGTLPPRETGPRVVLAGGPSFLNVGESCTVFGVVEHAPASERESAVTVEWLDAGDRAVATQTVNRSAGGAFSVTYRPDDSLAGQTLRVQARLGARALDAVDGRFTVHVRSADLSTATLAFQKPAQVLPADAKVLDFVVSAHYPGGIPVSGAPQTIEYTVGPLPSTLTPLTAPRYLARNDPLSQGGFSSYNPALDDFLWKERPLAVGARAVATAWDRRSIGAVASVLVGAPAYVWATLNNPPELGQPVQFEVHWHDPLQRAAGIPVLEVRAPGGEWRGIPLDAATNGLRTARWYPSTRGRFDVRCAMPLLGGTKAEFADSFEVAGDGEIGDRAEIRAAQRASDGKIGISLEGRHTGPLLVWLEGSQPRFAGALPTLEGETKLAVQDDGPVRAAYLAELVNGCLRVIDATPIANAPREEREPRLAVTYSDRLMGKIRGLSRSTRRIWVRITPAAEPTGFDWTAEAAPTFPDGRSVMAASRSVAKPGDAIRATQLPDDVSLALRAGQTLWAAELSADRGPGEIAFEVPEILSYDRYRVSLISVDAAGRSEVESQIVVKPDGPDIRLEIPSQLTLGDRVTASVAVKGLDAKEIEWRLQPGALCAALEQHNAAAKPISPQTWQFSIPVEAATAGEGEIAIVLKAGNREFTRRAKIHVIAPTNIPTGAKLSMVRRIYRLEAPPDAKAASSDEDEKPAQGWQRVTVETGERVIPGTQLIIEYRVRAAESVNGLSWRQRMPANCITLGSDPMVLRSPGQLDKARTTALTFHDLSLSAGDSVFEIAMMAAGVGTCVVPLPELSTNSGPIAVSSEDLRITSAVQ